MQALLLIFWTSFRGRLDAMPSIAARPALKISHFDSYAINRWKMISLLISMGFSLTILTRNSSPLSNRIIASLGGCHL
jgi:hypothetical protein